MSPIITGEAVVLELRPASFAARALGLVIDVVVHVVLLVLVMIVRPQGLLPERRRRLELTAEVAAEDAQLTEVSGSVGAST